MAHDPADTTRAATGVLDRHGNVRLMKSSGFRTILPNIAGVGTLRTRYPLMPVYAEGSPIWKELEALRDLDNGHGCQQEVPLTRRRKVCPPTPPLPASAANRLHRSLGEGKRRRGGGGEEKEEDEEEDEDRKDAE